MGWLAYVNTKTPVAWNNRGLVTARVWSSLSMLNLQFSPSP